MSGCHDPSIKERTHSRACDCRNSLGQLLLNCLGTCTKGKLQMEGMNQYKAEQTLKDIHFKLDLLQGMVPMCVTDEYRKGFKDGFMAANE